MNDTRTSTPQTILERFAPQISVFSGSILKRFDSSFEDLCQAILCMGKRDEMTPELAQKIKAGLLAAREISLPPIKEYSQAEFGDWEFELYSHQEMGKSLVIEQTLMPRYVLEFSLDNAGAFYQGAVSSDALHLGPVLFFVKPEPGKIEFLNDGLDSSLAKSHEFNATGMDFWTTPQSNLIPLLNDGQRELFCSLFSTFFKSKHKTTAAPSTAKESNDAYDDLPPVSPANVDDDDLPPLSEESSAKSDDLPALTEDLPALTEDLPALTDDALIAAGELPPVIETASAPEDDLPPLST